MKKRGILILLMLMMACLFTGCGKKKIAYTETEVREHILSWLENKFDEEFEILSLEDQLDTGAAMVSRRYYEYSARSLSTGIKFKGQTSYWYKKGSKDDYDIYDMYEEALYSDALEEEVNSIHLENDIWGKRQVDVYAYNTRYMEKGSKNYESFKSDTDRVSISISFYMYGEFTEEMLPDLYDYATRLYAINKNVDITIYKTDGTIASVRMNRTDNPDLEYFRKELFE